MIGIFFIMLGILWFIVGMGTTTTEHSKNNPRESNEIFMGTAYMCIILMVLFMIALITHSISL
jgi:uncharacterized membrane protein